MQGKGVEEPQKASACRGGSEEGGTGLVGGAHAGGPIKGQTVGVLYCWGRGYMAAVSGQFSVDSPFPVQFLQQPDGGPAQLPKAVLGGPRAMYRASLRGAGSRLRA